MSTKCLPLILGILIMNILLPNNVFGMPQPDDIDKSDLHSDYSSNEIEALAEPNEEIEEVKDKIDGDIAEENDYEIGDHDTGVEEEIPEDDTDESEEFDEATENIGDEEITLKNEDQGKIYVSSEDGKDEVVEILDNNSQKENKASGWARLKKFFNKLFNLQYLLTKGIQNKSSLRDSKIDMGTNTNKTTERELE